MGTARRREGDPSERKAFSNFPRDVTFTVGTYSPFAFVNMRKRKKYIIENLLFALFSGDLVVSLPPESDSEIEKSSWRWSSTGAGRAEEAASSTAPTAPRDGVRKTNGNGDNS